MVFKKQKALSFGTLDSLYKGVFILFICDSKKFTHELKDGFGNHLTSIKR